MVTKYYICPFEKADSGYKLFLPEDISEVFYLDYAGVLVAWFNFVKSGAEIIHPLSSIDRAKVKGEKEGYGEMICVVAPEVYFAMRTFFQSFASLITFNSPVDIEVVFLEYGESCVEYSMVVIEEKNEAYVFRKYPIAA